MGLSQKSQCFLLCNFIKNYYLENHVNYRSKEVLFLQIQFES